MNQQCVYVLGPMTGYPDDNRPAFRAAAEFLRNHGFKVTTPDELDQICPATVRSWSGFLRRDLPWLVKCDMGVALPGWRNSRGATLEATNMAELGMPVFELIEGALRQVPPEDLPRPSHPVSALAAAQVAGIDEASRH